MISTPSICASLSRKGSLGGGTIPGSDLKPIKYRCLRRTTVAEVLSPALLPAPVAESDLSSPARRSDAANASDPPLTWFV
jgi:hypothetical protein